MRLEAVFQPTESKPNFFDPKNWQIFIGSQRKNEPMLDIEKVPSDMVNMNFIYLLNNY